MRDLGLGERLKRADWLLLGLGVAFSLLGVVLVGTATTDPDGDATGSQAFEQLRWTVIGVAACLLVLAVPYARIVRWRWALYALSLVLLAAVLVVGATGGGTDARRWLRVGSLKLQPSEFVKVVLVVALAGYLRYERSYRRLKGLAIPFAMTLVPVVLITKQPDLGTALLLIPVLFVLLYVAGARPRHLGVVAATGAVAAVTLYVVPGLLNEYQKNRVRAFAHQDSGDEVLLREKGYQLHQSKTVVGSATALGLGTGVEAAEAVRFLDERHTDFVFPVLVTAFGTVGTTVFLLVYLLFVARVLSTALRVREPSGRLIAVGVAALFACQAAINMAMTLGLLPVVGMPLPFVSKGGSSLLTSFVALGLVLNVGADPPVEFGRGDFD